MGAWVLGRVLSGGMGPGRESLGSTGARRSQEEVGLLPVKEAVEHPGLQVSVTAVVDLIC